MTENLFNPEAFEQMPGQISMAADNEWRAARAAAEPLKRGSACVFTYDERLMSGEVDDISSCGITVYGREDGRRHLVGSQDVRRESPREQDRRERLGYYVEDDPECECECGPDDEHRFNPAPFCSKCGGPCEMAR